MCSVPSSVFKNDENHSIVNVCTDNQHLCLVSKSSPTWKCVYFVCFSECRVCIPSPAGHTCCVKGGSWYGRCGRFGDNKFDHTWSQGLKACVMNRAVNVNKKVKIVNNVQEKEGSPLISNQKQVISKSVIITVTPVTMIMILICCFVIV